MTRVDWRPLQPVPGTRPAPGAALLGQHTPGVVAGVGQRIAAAVPQHVRVDWERHFGPLTDPPNSAWKALGVIGPSRSVIKTCEDSPCSRYFFLAALVAIGCEAVTLEDIYRAVRIVGRVRGYELALGFLAATVVWAMFFVFQPKNDAAQGQTHQATSAESKEITSAKEVEDRLATYTLWLAIFTAVLAVSTIGLWIVTWRSGVRQSRDMENAIAAAQEANRISREGIIAEQRAWLTAGDLNIESEPVYEKSGITIVVSVQITNRGKTPALHVHTDMDMVFDSNAAPAAVMKLAEKNKTVDIVQWTRTALPNDPYRRRWVFTIERSKSLGNSNSVFPVIVGCVTYRILPDKSVHQTGFVFDLFQCYPGEPNRFARLIEFDGTPLNRHSIGWDGGSGGFAD